MSVTVAIAALRTTSVQWPVDAGRRDVRGTCPGRSGGSSRAIHSRPDKPRSTPGDYPAADSVLARNLALFVLGLLRLLLLLSVLLARLLLALLLSLLLVVSFLALLVDRALALGLVVCHRVRHPCILGP